MAFDVEAAKAAGYSQEEINAYLQGQPKTKALAPIAPGQEADVGEPPPPTTTVTPAGEGNYMPTLATAGLAAAGAAAPAVIGYGVGKYGGRMIDAARNLIQGGGTSAAAVPTTNPTAINLPTTTPTMQPPMGQSAPTTSTGRAFSPQAQQFLQQQASAQEAQQIQKANSIVRQLALDKVLKSAGGLLRGSVGPGMALYSGGLNTNEQQELARRRNMPPTITGQ